MVLVSQSQLIEAAIAGQVVSFPTDTVPALAVKPENSDLIYQLKQRQTSKPLILMAAQQEQLWAFLAGDQADRQRWQKVMDRHWPGAITLVLPASEELPTAINPTQNGTIGVRIPDSSIARAILQATGPLATTSANLSGQPPLRKLSEISNAFHSVICLDCGELEIAEPLGHGLPSTVAQWQGDRGRFAVLRQGSIIIEDCGQ